MEKELVKHTKRVRQRILEAVENKQSFLIELRHKFIFDEYQQYYMQYTDEGYRICIGVFFDVPRYFVTSVTPTKVSLYSRIMGNKLKGSFSLCDVLSIQIC